MDPVSTTVSIYGQDYTVRSESEPGYVQRVATFVDRRMREVAKQSSQVSSLRVAVLAAMTMADELLRERESPRAKGLDEKAHALADALEASFLSPTPESDPADDGPSVASAEDGSDREES